MHAVNDDEMLKNDDDDEDDDDDNEGDDDDDDESMESYDTSNDQSAAIGNSCLNFDNEASTSHIQSPPTIAHLPNDQDFDGIE